MGTVKKKKPVKIKFETTEISPDKEYIAKEAPQPNATNVLSNRELSAYYSELASIENGINEHYTRIDKLLSRKRLLQEQPDKFIAITNY